MNSSNADIPKTGSMEKFQKLLREIAEIDEKLTCDSKAIDNNLTLQEQSTKRSADLLLVQKRLYHQVLEMQIRCLHNTWKTYLVQLLQSLQHLNIDQKFFDIDGIRKFVGG
jgi:hypothetical protein